MIESLEPRALLSVTPTLHSPPNSALLAIYQGAVHQRRATAALNSGVLQIIGRSNAANDIQVDLRGSRLCVRLNGHTDTFVASRVKRIEIRGGQRDDRITISQNVTPPASIWGGAGNDRIAAAGRGRDVVHGEAGDDVLVGDPRHDTLLGGCGHDKISYLNSPRPTDAAAANDQFAWDLYAKLRQQPGNVFFSPLSASVALSMAAVGARGQTLSQMMQVLHLPSQFGEQFRVLLQQLRTVAPGHPQVKLADAIWAQEGMPLQDDFVAAVADNFGSQPGSLDFTADPEGARQSINDWAADQTNQRITNLLPPGSITPRTRMVLANAIYFLGKWASEFSPEATRDGDFTLSAGAQITTPLMWQNNYYNYYDGGTFQALEIPYQGGDKSMVVLLPRQQGGLAALEQQLSAGNVAEWLRRMQSRNVNLTLPKFNITTGSMSLAQILQQLGMTDAFSGHADFSGITTAGPLQISDVIQKAYVTVAEGGTEAAAVTGVVVGVTACPVRPVSPPPIEFRADHPFVFLIRDNQTGSTLFAGRVERPEAPTADQALPAGT